MADLINKSNCNTRVGNYEYEYREERQIQGVSMYFFAPCFNVYVDAAIKVWYAIWEYTANGDILIANDSIKGGEDMLFWHNQPPSASADKSYVRNSGNHLFRIDLESSTAFLFSAKVADVYYHGESISIMEDSSYNTYIKGHKIHGLGTLEPFYSFGRTASYNDALNHFNIAARRGSLITSANKQYITNYYGD